MKYEIYYLYLSPFLVLQDKVCFLILGLLTGHGFDLCCNSVWRAQLCAEVWCCCLLCEHSTMSALESL